MKLTRTTDILRVLTALVLALILVLGTVTTTLAAVADDVAASGAVSFSVKKGMPIYLNAYQAKSWFSNDSCVARIYFATSSSGSNSTSVEVTTLSDNNKQYVAYAPADGYNYVKVSRYNGNDNNASSWFQITGIETNTVNFSDTGYTEIGRSWNDTAATNSGYGNIYFDNTTSNWTITSTNQLYFVIGTADNISMLPMQQVTNAPQLYYYASGSWGGYDLFGFALASTTYTKISDLKSGALAYTTLYGFYNLANGSESTNNDKSFISYGLNDGACVAMHTLWVDDNALSTDPVWHTNEYLNRGQKLTVTGRGSANISGYKITSKGISGATSQAATTVGSNSNSTVYYARSSTVTLSDITPASGYELTALTVNGTDVLTAYNTNGGSYTYTVPGGDDNDSSDIPVNVTFTKTGATDVFLLGLWETGHATKTVWEANSTNNSDRLMNYAASLTVGNETFTNVYYLDMVLTGNKTYSASESETVDGTSVQNGFKIYDSDLDSPWLSNSGTYSSNQTWWSLTDTTNCGLTTISSAGSATYRFVYDPSHSIDGTTKPCVRVYYPQIITYNNNESTAVTGGTPSADTTSSLVVAYGEKAKNITPTRDGYAFGGWYTDRACTSAYDFSTSSVTSALTLYAKWTVNTVNIKVHGTQNGVDMGDAVTKSVNGITGTQITANNAASGYVFTGWVISGEMGSHLKLYTDSACMTAYTAGSDVKTLYIKTDGAAGITVDNAVITAVYLTQNQVSVSDGSSSTTSTAETYYTAISGKTTNPQDFYYGSAITVSFDNLPAGFGIESVTFADGTEVDYVNYGHYISFEMPAHNVTITDISVTPFTCRITVKNSSTVDIDGLSSSGYYSTGADVHTITIKGSDDYYGTSVLNSLTVKYIGGTPITVDAEHPHLTTTFDGSTLDVVFSENTVTITGHIGGNVILTPECSTQYNVNITSKVMSDVSSKYITYNKKSTTADGSVESVVIAELNAYLQLDSAPANKAAAEEIGVVWPLQTTTNGGFTYYLIESDEDGDYIGKFDKDSQILLKTENLNGKYTFIGWFGGSSTGPDLTMAKSTDLTFDYTLGESSFIYGVVTRDIYIGGQGPSGNSGFNVSWSNAAKMTYDEKNMVYFYETGSLWSSDNGVNNYYFKIFDQASTGNTSDSGTTNQAVWYNAAKTITYNQDYGVRLSGHMSTGTNEKATFQLYHSDSAYENIDSDKVRIYYKPSSQEVYVIPVYNSTYHEVYLSNGRIDGMSKIGLALNTPTQAFTTPSSGISTGTTVSSTDTQTENYSYYKFTDSTTVNFTITVNGTNASDVKVAGFVVYNMDSGEATTAEATKSGNVYSGTVTISANTFICPVYELTDSYITGNNIQAFEVFVNAADVDTAVWGDLVSMYVFGGSGQARDYNGAWPGQLMLPSGKSFSGVVYKKSGEDLSGIVFENYNSTSSFFGKFGKRFNYPDWAQTYDYLEPITLMGDGTNADTTMLSFSLKQNNDGYRGSYYNSESKKKGPYYLDVYNEENNETKQGVVYSYHDEGLDEDQTLFDNYTFEYLTDKDGKNRLNLYGESVGSASAGYYVVCVGDTDYLNNSTPNGKTYDPATGYNGRYSVEWYVYDADGVFLLHTLSDALYGQNGASENSYIVDKLLASGLIKNPTTLKEKSVKISYEAPNTRGFATRFSGQWYSNSTNEKVTVFAGVGMITDDGKVIVPENPQSTASYGSATISFTSEAVSNGAVKGTVTGLNWGSLTLSDASRGATTLTATVPSTSTFKGWYSYNETTDSYTKVSDSTVYSPKFSTESRFFAMFSAQATYYFTYPGRSGSTVIYSVKAEIGASETEMSNGGILSADTTGTVDGSTKSRAQEIIGIITSLGNNLRVFNHNLTFTADPTKWDVTNPYEITIEGASTEALYKLTVYAYNSEGTLVKQSGTFGGESRDYIEGAFNTRIDLTESPLGGAGSALTENHPEGQSVFLGWKQYNGSSVTGDFLSTHVNFGYALSEDLTIAPVFGSAKPAAANTWKAYVDKNVITQELTDPSNGTIYNDNIISFRFSNDSADRFTGECGIVILAQAGGTAADSAQRSSFSSLATGEKISASLNALKGLGSGTTSAKLKSATYGEAYAFYIQATSLSALNRVDIFQHLDYAKFNGGQYIVAAYFKDGNEYKFSDVVSGTYTPHVTSRSGDTPSGS